MTAAALADFPLPWLWIPRLPELLKPRHSGLVSPMSGQHVPLQPIQFEADPGRMAYPLLGPATITFAGSAGDAGSGPEYTISIEAGAGGDVIVAFWGHNLNRSVSGTPTIDGQNITIHDESQDASSESTQAMGTASGVGAGAVDLVVTWSGTQLHCIGFVWVVTNVDLTTPAQAGGTDGFTHTMSTYTADSVVAACSCTGSGTEFTGATNINFDGNNKTEGNMAGASNESSALGGTALSFTGAPDSQAVTSGLELNNG